MLDIFYFQGIPVKTFTSKALLELEEHGFDLFDVVEFLENGFDCERSTRKSNIFEKCVVRGKKVVKIVIEKLESKNLNNYWSVRHIGVFISRKNILVKDYEFIERRNSVH